MRLHYEISVWDTRDGDLVKKVWDGDSFALDAALETYDDPWFDIVVDNEWESDDE